MCEGVLVCEGGGGVGKGGHGSQHVGSVIGLGNFKTSVSVSVIR